ncbi:hypothetical protein N798_08670 [Knoellia flava TL1]|uniref:Uncharacterized protein n=2 Tax=Knoellia flava TaxID=913969 RepID=A0A8H9FSZ4_9MICO|nr:hypothetical protein N798_08670 [Knoellia flava TL1]GGB68314.1 hypothetical protein GCM10011314_04480 [Knoellia flava]
MVAALAALAVLVVGILALALPRNQGSVPAGTTTDPAPSPRPTMSVRPGPTGPGEAQFEPSGPPLVTPTEPAASDIGSATPSSGTAGG